MPEIIYVAHTGEKYSFEAAVGQTVMDVAVKNNLPGIVAECCGACACATCHVYVGAVWLDVVARKSSMENSMLEYAIDVRPSSRLSCQIKMTTELDGLVVTLPESQI